MTQLIHSDALDTHPTNLADDCSLSSTDLASRLSMIRKEIAPFAMDSQRLESGMSWDFQATDQIRDRLENLVRLERDCCGHLEFQIWENPGRTRLRLEISGVDPNTGYFDALVTSDTESDDPPRVRWLRLGRRGALAAGVSFFVCCVIPGALVSFAGMKVAAPLMKLDNPVVIAAGTVLFTSLFWFRERRRPRTASVAAKDPKEASSCGC